MCPSSMSASSRAGDPTDLCGAAQNALVACTRDGEECIRRRQACTPSKHMLAHRLQKMVRAVGTVVDGRLRIGNGAEEGRCSGLEPCRWAPWLLQLPQRNNPGSQVVSAGT